MNAPLTETQRAALKWLVRLRANARGLVKYKAANTAEIKRQTVAKEHAIRIGDRLAEVNAQVRIETLLDSKVSVKFSIIEMGREFIKWSPAIAETLPRDVWLEALSVNRSEWNTAEMREEGTDPARVVGLLGLENSASLDIPESKPLQRCFQAALYNAIKTNQRLAKNAHDMANEIFEGRFGEWDEPTTLQRCGVSA